MYVHIANEKQVQFCCVAGCSRRETFFCGVLCTNIWHIDACSMLPRKQLTAFSGCLLLTGAGNGKRDAAG